MNSLFRLDRRSRIGIVNVNSQFNTSKQWTRLSDLHSQRKPKGESHYEQLRLVG